MKKTLIWMVVIVLFFAFTHTSFSASIKKFYIPVLTYHHIQEKGTFNPDKQGRLIVTPEQLEKQLIYIKLAGFNPITSQELNKYYNREMELPANPILITFDDGYNSTYTYVFPMLKKLKFKATVFVPVILIRDNKKNTGHPAFFTWQQAKEMVDSDLIDVQSHTYDLHRTITIQGEDKNIMTNKLTVNEKQETDQQYIKRIEDDLIKSKKIIESYLGNQVVAISFPFGDFNKTCQTISNKVGLTLQFSTVEGVNSGTNNPGILKRITIDQKYSGQAILRIIKKFTFDKGEIPYLDIENHWAEYEILKLINNEIIKGYPNLVFRPNNYITRTELLCLLDAIKPFSLTKKKMIFYDVPRESWYYDIINRAYASNIIKGYNDQKFLPNQKITRQEAITIIARHLFSEVEIGGNEIEKYSDNEFVAKWAQKEFCQLTKMGIINGTKIGGAIMLKPNENLTRAEAATLIFSSVKILYIEPN